MSVPSAESTPSSVLWDVLRYVIVAAISGALIWYYFFYTPINYVNRECTGKTLGTDYIVQVAQFPENADWNKIATAIQERLDALDKNPSTNGEHPTLAKDFPNLAIDLSTITGGMAVDCVAELLEEQKITDFFIEIGNDVRSKGKKTKEKDWTVGIEKPALELSSEFLGLQQAFALKDQSLATRQPKQPGELASVTVIAPTCTIANAWVMVLLDLGEQKGVELAQQHGIAALFLLRSGDDIVEVPTKHWRK